MKRVALFAVIGLASMTGCATHYEDASASYRSVGDSSELRNDYWGLSFRFAVDGPEPYHSPASDQPSFASAE